MTAELEAQLPHISVAKNKYSVAAKPDTKKIIAEGRVKLVEEVAKTLVHLATQPTMLNRIQLMTTNTTNGLPMPPRSKSSLAREATEALDARLRDSGCTVTVIEPSPTSRSRVNFVPAKTSKP